MWRILVRMSTLAGTKHYNTNRSYRIFSADGSPKEVVDYSQAWDIVIDYNELNTTLESNINWMYLYEKNWFTFSVKTDIKTKKEAYEKYKDIISPLEKEYIKEQEAKKEEEKRREIQGLISKLRNSFNNINEDISVIIEKWWDEVLPIIADVYLKSYQKMTTDNSLLWKFTKLLSKKIKNEK